MPAEQTSASGSPKETSDVLTSDVLLRKFFETSPAGKRAAASLKKGVAVGVRFTDVPGDFQFVTRDGQPHFDAGKASDPDFELTLAPGAVRAITSKPDSDVGELGITFFQHIVAKDPAEKIHVKLHAGLLKLTMHGWLGVLAAGGPKVMGWMAQKGLKGPSAVASALSRLKKG